jgi:hypothetical protein
MKESEILLTAIGSLETLTGTRIDPKEKKGKDSHWDALLHVETGLSSVDFKAEIRATVLPAHLPRLAGKLSGSDCLLVAKYISSPAKELMEKQGINYLDMAGNCFIRNDSGIFWFIRGQQLPSEAKTIKHEAFHKNGIKLLYTLLLRPERVNETYRSLAQKANISASTVGDILQDLKEGKFLLQVNEHTMMLTNRAELLNLWVTAFNRKLKPKISKGKFRWADNQTRRHWKQLDLSGKALWGGEPAAEILTHYLQPGEWALYTGLNRQGLMKEFGLIPDSRQGYLEVFDFFWEQGESSFVLPEAKTVHPLLVYADLIASGDSRNIETAKRIYEQYLKNLIEQDNG